MVESPSALIHPSRIPNRWVQLIAGIVAMMAIANLQYAWTLFTKPIQAHLHVSLEAVQVTFFVFVALETWLVPFEGFLVDLIGPRFMLGIGSVMVGLGWVGSGYAESINSLYFWYGVGGVGAGIVYGGAIGNALPIQSCQASSRESLTPIRCCSGESTRNRPPSVNRAIPPVVSTP